jgi:hypothetical protein
MLWITCVMRLAHGHSCGKGATSTPAHPYKHKVSCDHNVWRKIDALRTIVFDVLATPTQDGEGASSAAAAQRLVMMGGRLAWQLRAWVVELGTSGGYNTLMEVCVCRSAAIS